jgi:hypothetical protein
MKESKDSKKTERIRRKLDEFEGNFSNRELEHMEL